MSSLPPNQPSGPNNSGPRNEEGEHHLKKAGSCNPDNHTSSGVQFFDNVKSIFSSADYGKAAFHYEKAALAFRRTDKYRALLCYEQQAECLAKNNQLFHSAKACEEVANLHKEIGNWNSPVKKDAGQSAIAGGASAASPGSPIAAPQAEIGTVGVYLKWMKTAVCRYREYGTPETAANALLKAAKVVEKTSSKEEAIAMYNEVIGIYENEHNYTQAADISKEIPRLFLQLDKQEEAVKALEKELEYNRLANEECRQPLISRLVVCLVILHLKRENKGAARDVLTKATETYPGFADTSEEDTLKELLQASDNDTAKEILNRPLFKYLDNEFSKLARELQMTPPDGLFEEADPDNLL